MNHFSTVNADRKMTSILTNFASHAALQTLRSLGSQVDRVQAQVSSGMRVETASDNAAYWSISTTMRSDNMAISAVADALGLGAAKVDTAYAGIDAAIDVMEQFKARLVTAKEDGIDRSKIQGELEQFKQQLVSISESASFSGENWLSTSITDILDSDQNKSSVVASFVRDANGSVSVKTMAVDLSEISLFNTTGGGILQKDDRSPGTIGGLRNTDAFTYGGGSIQSFTFDGPLVFADDTTAITFDMMLDADDPSTTTSPGGGTTVSVTLNRTLMDQVYPTLNGVISSRDQFAWLMREAILPLGALFATQGGTTDGYALLSRETSGLPGSSIQVLNVASTLAGGSTGGLVATGTSYGSRPSVVSYWDEAFTVHSTAEIYVPVTVNGTTTTIGIDRSMVDATLGTTTGEVTSQGDLVAILNAGFTAQGVGVIASSQAGYIKYEVDETVHKEAGSKTSLGIGPASDNLGNLPEFGILDVDITDDSMSLDNYITGIEGMLGKLTKAGSVLGSVQKRIDIQQDFASKLMNMIDKGIGRLVDADMNEASTRLKALQTQEQLAIQSLQIANTNSEHILTLFR